MVQRSRRSFTRENARGHDGRRCFLRDTDVYSRRDGKVSRRFPSTTVTLFAPDDSYLGTRKFMDLLTTQGRTHNCISTAQCLCRWYRCRGFAYDENITRKDTRQFSPSSLPYSNDLRFIRLADVKGWHVTFPTMRETNSKIIRRLLRF